MSSTGAEALSFLPSKKGSAHVVVPVLAQLLEELELHPEREVFMATETGAPFASPEAMRNKIQAWTAEAGLPKGRTQHGIRKGAAELLAGAGATQYEIMSLMSHTQAQTSEVYTRQTDRRTLAARAIARLSAIDLANVDHAA
nr:tyrosine-type recombinase/integrase [Roseivivax halotolerans]